MIRGEKEKNMSEPEGLVNGLIWWVSRKFDDQRLLIHSNS